MLYHIYYCTAQSLMGKIFDEFDKLSSYNSLKNFHLKFLVLSKFYLLKSAVTVVWEIFNSKNISWVLVTHEN